MLGGENIHTGTQGAHQIPSSALQACFPQGLAVGWECREGTATSSATPMWLDRQVPQTVLEDDPHPGWGLQTAGI